jgi:zinc and cadmium transporter
MNALFWLLGVTIFNSLLGFAGIFSLWFREATLNKIIKVLVAFSAGVLLGGGFFHLLAESLDHLNAMLAFGITIVGFLFFFVFEGYLHWHHCEKCDIHPYSYLMLIGDAIHNFIDGLVLAGTFAISIPLGLATSLMVLGHELPQELGVFAVLISGGFEKTKAMLYSFLAQSTCVLGGISGFLFFGKAEGFLPYLLSFAAGGFIYIAAADLIPGMHKAEGKEKITSFIWLCLGLLFMLAIKIFFEA